MVGNPEWIYVHKEGLVNTDPGERDLRKRIVSIESESPELVKLRVSINGTPDTTLISVQNSLQKFLDASKDPTDKNYKALPEGFTFVKSVD